MMYFLLCVCVLSFWPATLAANQQKTTKDLIKLLSKDCQAKTGATQADIDALRSRQFPETKTGRCFVDCLFNNVKIMDNGKFNKYGMVVAFTPSTKGDLTKMGKLRELSDVCEREIGGKHYKNCEGAKKVVQCVAKNGKAYGIDFTQHKNL